MVRARRLLLASHGIGALPELVATAGLRVAFVPTAAGEEADDQWWVKADRGQLRALGCTVTALRLEASAPEKVMAALRRVDAVFVTGGNSYLLLGHARRSGFAQVTPSLVESGALLYIGTSAGAILAGPDLSPAVNPAANRIVPPLKSTECLGLVPFSVLPHDQEPGPHGWNAALMKEHGDAALIALRDDQAVLVREDTYTVVDSPLLPAP